MALSQSLQQKLLQKLSPQQIQLMKLLQVPTANLEERIKEELEENPALEVDEEKPEEYEESKEEFNETAEEQYDEPDGSNDEYENIDISEYVHVMANQRNGSCTPINKYPIKPTTPCIRAIKGMPIALALTVVPTSSAMRSTLESLRGIYSYSLSSIVRL